MEKEQNAIIGKRILEIRKTLGMSQAEIADAAKVSQPYLCQLEQGKFAPTVPVVLRLAKALRVPVEHLLRQEETETKRRCS